MAVNSPDKGNTERIEAYFDTSSYQESLEISAGFNRRLSLERVRRVFPKTKRQCSSFQLKSKHRMPGLRSGQIYSFPALRWRRSKRSTPVKPQRDSGHMSSFGTGSIPDESSSSDANFSLMERFHPDTLDGETSRDTNNNSKDELNRDWLYDDLEDEFDTFSEPKSPDEEYDPKYGNKPRNKKASKKDGKTKKTSTMLAFGGFDTTETSAPGKNRRRAKESPQTPKKGAETGKVGGRTRRKVRNNVPWVADPPSFESAAASIDDNLPFSSPLTLESNDFATYSL